MTKAEVMAQKSKEKQFDFEKDLSINKYKLDEECLSHSSLYFRYAEASITAKSEVSKADDNLKLVTAERNIAIRKAYTDAGAKFTEAVIASELEKDAKVLEAKERLRDAQEVYAKLQVAVSAMESRRSQLDNLVKLYCAGYFSTPTASNETRKNVNEQTANAVRKNLNKSVYKELAMVDKKKKGGLAKRYQASYESKGSSGGKAGVMDWKKVDGEVQFFSPAEGRNRINIIPYTIKSKNHPLVKKGEFEVGDKDYVMDIFVHRGVGPSEASVLCLKNTYGKPCPICEQSALLRKQGKEDEAGALKPSRRVFYNVQDLKNPDVLKVFEASHYLFEKELIDEARDDEEGGFVDFADEESGKEIKFRRSKTSKGGFEFNEFKSFSFEDRDENIPDELLESAISFDEIMNVPTYEEAEKILYGRDEDEDSEDEEEEDEVPAKKSSKKAVAKDEDDDDADDDEEEPAPKKTAKKKPAVEEDDEDEDLDEDEEEEEKPAKKPAKKSKVVEEDNDDEQEDEDDEPPAKKPSKKEKDCGGDCKKCPFGHKFGEDTDEFDDCDDCDVWDKCINGGK